MRVEKRPIKMYIEEAFCEACNSAMVHTGIVYYSCPARYGMECSNCGKTKITEEIYPKYVYEYIKE